MNGLWINKDLSEVTRIRATETQKCYNLLRKQKLKCKLNGTTIHYDNKSFDYDELHLLPVGCRPEDAQMVTCANDKSLCFQGAHAYVSNFHPAELTYENQLFSSAEQAFQWTKANQNNDTEKANMILDTDNPHVIKKLGEQVKTSHEWRQEEESILADIVKQKFLQNKNLLDRFVSSQHENYYECTVGSMRGCGSTINRIDLDPELLKGKNRFGEILKYLKMEFKAAPKEQEQDQVKK